LQYEDFERTVKTKNLTRQRSVILAIVKEALDHPTASDIIERLRVTGYNFAYGTVYNSLKYLTAEGLIRELKLGGGISHYDGRVEDHQHIVCRRCHKVSEVHFEAPDSWKGRVASETGFQVEEVQILYEGLCPTCQTVTAN